ncbi:MAG: nucleoside hydrolase [Bacteroidota bacterium]
MQRRIRLGVFCLVFCFGHFLSGQETKKFSVILDADTGNEVDDYYALVAALIEPSWEVLALNATQWQTSHWAIPQSMENSHRLNQVLLGELGKSVKTRRGGVARMFDWGDQAQHSAAAYEIIQQAKAKPEGEKLNIIALGALTNVGSAIFIDPSIASKIRLYWLGSTYDFEKEIYKKMDFNCVMDVQALETVLESEVEMHVIPVNIASAMKFEFTETEEKLPKDHPLSRLLLDRWYEHLDGSRKSRTIWDLSIVQAIRHPEWATTQTVTTSKDNGSRKITFYKSIDADKMRDDFFQQVNAFFSRQ